MINDDGQAIVHDMRVTAAGIHLDQPMLLTAPAQAFAQMVIQRYAPGQASRPSPEMVLREVLAGVTLQQVDRRAVVHLAPRLSLTVLAWPESLARLPAPRMATLAEQPPRVVPTKLHPAEQLVCHVVMRMERVESVVGSARSGAAGTAAHPVPRVVNRPATGVVSSAVPPPTPDADHGAVRTGVRGAGNGPGGADPTRFDVNRLADQVIHTIDRRIIAQRERLGKV